MVSKRQCSLVTFRDANDDQQLCDALGRVPSDPVNHTKTKERTAARPAGPYTTRTHLNMADRQKHEIRHVRVQRKGNDKDDADRRVECGRFDDHGGRGPVRRDFFFAQPAGFRSEGEEAGDDEERVDEHESDLEAEIGELGVDVVKDGTDSFGEDKNGHDCDASYRF